MPPCLIGDNPYILVCSTYSGSNALIAGNIILITNGVAIMMCGRVGINIQENNSGAHFSNPISIPNLNHTADNASGIIVANSTIFAVLSIFTSSVYKAKDINLQVELS